MIFRSNNNFQLSDHFNLKEFECPCCHRVRIDNRLIPLLELVRAEFGKPIIITSGYRCPAHNAVIFGSPNSDHIYGWAADIIIEGVTGRDLAKVVACYMKEGRIGIYKKDSHVHVGVVHREGFPDKFEVP